MRESNCFARPSAKRPVKARRRAIGVIPALALLLVVACSNRVQVAPNPASAPADSAPPETTLDAAPATMNPLAEKADALFRQAFEDGIFTGSIVVVDGGETVLSKAYGDAIRKEAKPNEVDTVFRIGSLSKQFTASAILALAKDGKLNVADPVSKYFPEYPAENLTMGGVEVTLHHLLSHTSGLPDARKTDYFKENVWAQPIESDPLIAEAKLLPLVRKPGTKFEYLNYNYFLLGLVIERVSGESYESFLESRFFGPLGMKDSGTILDGQALERAAIGYYKEKSGSLVTMDGDLTFRDHDLTFAFGSGQVYSTVADLARWDRALAEDKIAGQDQLFKPNLANYGYGWSIESEDGVDYQWHNGAISPLGFSSFLIRIPSKQRMVAYLSNLDIDITQDLEAKVVELALE